MSWGLRAVEVLVRPGASGVSWGNRAVERPGASAGPPDSPRPDPGQVSWGIPGHPRRARTKDFTLHNARGCACVGRRHSKRPPDEPKGFFGRPQGFAGQPRRFAGQPQGFADRLRATLICDSLMKGPSAQNVPQCKP